MNRQTFYLDLLERTIWTFIQSFAATLIASGLDIATPITNLSIGEKASVAAVAGGVAVLKALVVNQLPWTAQNSASTLPAEVDPPANEGGHGSHDLVMVLATVWLAVIFTVWAFKSGPFS